jgi:hypothetical protein
MAVFGNSGFAYIFAAGLFGLVVAEMYRVLVYESLQSSRLSPQQIGNAFCGAVIGTCLLTSCIAALLG